MIFTSYGYLLFLSVAFLLHWALPRGLRKPFLVAASYFFYCTWDWRFGFLLLGVSVFNWAFGRFLAARRESGRFLAAGIAANLAPLLYYKYTGFLLANIGALLSAIGSGARIDVPAILLPLGISFFTFQGIAYLVDVWSGDDPFERLPDFLLFKGFWPQLIAGPIVRPHEIAGQILSERTLRYEALAEGGQRILFGFFKKVVVADTMGPYLDAVFLRGAAPNAIDGVFGAVGFGLQIYLDFSAYSDIAIGSARLFGFRFPENFDWPYVSSSPQEFWNRWHMTLSRWIRDYVFTPIRFATRRYPRTAHLWLLLAMGVCGLWHGAQWTFVLWGLWHGLLLVLNQTLLKGLFAPNPKRLSPSALRLRRACGCAATFAAAAFGWVLFRSPDLATAGTILEAVLTLKGGVRPAILRENTILYISAVLLFLWILQAGRERIEARLSEPAGRPFGAALRGALYATMAVAIVVFDESARAFVYFQF